MSVVVMIMNGTATRPSVSTVPTAAPAAIETVNCSVPHLHFMNPKDGPGGMQLCLHHCTISHQLFSFCPGNHVAWKVERTRVRCPGAWEELSPTQLLGSPKWRSPQRPLVRVKVAELWRSAAQ